MNKMIQSDKITALLGIELPILSGGMVWCSGWRLAAAVSNCGGLGLIGAGSMHPETLQEHIRKCKAATNKPYGVNVPLNYPQLEVITDIILQEQVPVVVTSAGSPKKLTATFKNQGGCKVMHVVSSAAFAVKAQDAGVDAVIAEGFEAGGHNGREETTTLCLIPQVVQAVHIPVLAAGGIASGQAILAAEALGACGVQIGTLFALSQESSAHPHFKQLCLGLGEGSTMLSLKQLAPARLVKNAFYQKVAQAEAAGSSVETMRALLGKGRAKRGIFEGDLEEGELEIGQAVSLVSREESVATIMERLGQEYQSARQRLAVG